MQVGKGSLECISEVQVVHAWSRTLINIDTTLISDSDGDITVIISAVAVWSTDILARESDDCSIWNSGGNIELDEIAEDRLG